LAALLTWRRVKLFGPKIRDLTRYPLNGEHDFEYLDKSARPEAARVRDFLERAFSFWPAERQAEMAARMPTKNYRSASFELVLHELLRPRAKTVHVEPPKEGTPNRPDFLAEMDWGSFYLEAIDANEETPERIAERKRVGELVDLVNQMPSDNFFVGFEIEAAGPGQPSAASIKGYLSTKLKGLDPDDDSIWIGDEGYQAPEWVWEDAGWRIVFRPMPKKAEARGAPGRRPVGTLSERLHLVDGVGAIRGAVKTKATRYGPMDRPYVIAVNLNSFSVDEVDYVDALFGSLVIIDRETEAGFKSYPVRENDGSFGWAKKPRYTRVSAVAIFNDVDPWNVAQRRGVLVHNPWGTHPLPTGQLGIDEAQYVGGALQRQPGVPLWSLLELPADWPRG